MIYMSTATNTLSMPEADIAALLALADKDAAREAGLNIELRKLYTPARVYLNGEAVSYEIGMDGRIVGYLFTSPDSDDEDAPLLAAFEPGSHVVGTAQRLGAYIVNVGAHLNGSRMLDDEDAASRDAVLKEHKRRGKETIKKFFPEL
jgi:hypothetical protein